MRTYGVGDGGGLATLDELQLAEGGDILVDVVQRIQIARQLQHLPAHP